MRERQGNETASSERPSASERPRRLWKRQRLIVAAVVAILVGVVVGWLAYTVLSARAAPLLGAPAGGHRPEPVMVGPP
jgi:predicted lysophospholipase L1 biosynthesis ABC-type transport system permease subunit